MALNRHWQHVGKTRSCGSAHLQACICAPLYVVCTLLKDATVMLAILIGFELYDDM